MRPYDIGSIVTLHGKQWRVTDYYFELRKLESVDNPNSDEFMCPSVTVVELDKENKSDYTPLPFDELPKPDPLYYYYGHPVYSDVDIECIETKLNIPPHLRNSQ